MRNQDGSWDIFDDYVLDFALERMRAGERVAIVTLVEIDGSSPRPLGAQMAVTETGRWVGYLSGGCVERAVVAEALHALDEGKSRRIRYGRGSPYMDIRLPCGSAIELVFDVTVKQADLEAIDAKLLQRQPATMRVPLIDRGVVANRHEGRHMVRSYAPRRRLIVAGVGPVAVQLARLARTSGFHVVLWSPDEPTRQATSDFDIDRVKVVSPSSIPRLDADNRTAIALVFHDHDWEAKLLPAALHTQAFYIGAMGSDATHRLRLERLKAEGFGIEDIERIHGPAGLFLSAKSAADIAISILAQVLMIDQESGHISDHSIMSAHNHLGLHA